MVTATLAVRRFDPEQGEESRWQRYDVELPDGTTVLEALMFVQEHVDGSLAFRRSCRHGVCGSCGMRVNGCARLACNTQLAAVVEEAERRAAHAHHTVGADAPDDGRPSVRIEPLGNMPVIKDLVTDMTVFWEKLRRVQPWLQPLDESPSPDAERRMTPAQYAVLAEGLMCVECGACYSDCIAVEAAPEFVGPTALVKAYRYAYDVRDDQTHRRLYDLSDEHGMWECTRCYTCTQRCPKHLRVRELIGRLAELSQIEGLSSDAAVKRAKAFVEGIEETGRVDERTLPLATGGPQGALGDLPAAARAAASGKMKLGKREAVDDVETVRRVVARAKESGGTTP